MENETNNNTKELKTITFKPEISGLKGELFPSIFLFILGFVVYFAPKPIELRAYVRDPRIYLLVSGVLCFIGLIKFLKLKIYIKSHKYILTQQRLTVEKGFLSKKVSNLELWRVVDIEMKQSASELATGGCTIVLTTQDLSDPIMNIKGLNIKHGKEIYQLLTDYIAFATKHSGVTRMM